MVIMLLAGCLGDRPVNAGGDALPATAPEHLVAPVPEDWHAAHMVTSRQVDAEEYVPSGESRLHWTHMMTVVWMPRDMYPTLAALSDVLGGIMKKGCGVPPVIGEAQRFTDNGYPATLQTLRCGRSPAGFGHVMVVKTIKGTNAYFQVQRAWQLPAARASADVVVGGADMKAALDYLDGIHLCDASNVVLSCAGR